MSINTALIGELKYESANTRKILEHVPADKLDWQPHERSMKLGRLATHIAELPVWVERILAAVEFDFATVQSNRESKASTEEILKVFDEKLTEAVKTLDNATDDNLNSMWTFRRGEQIIIQLPKKIAIRNIVLNHTYHHRGQLSVYLRLLGEPVPGMYGPSADEKF